MEKKGLVPSAAAMAGDDSRWRSRETGEEETTRVRQSVVRLQIDTEKMGRKSRTVQEKKKLRKRNGGGKGTIRVGRVNGPAQLVNASGDASKSHC